MGGELGSDGRLNGTVETVTIQCDTTALTCAIPVKAPSIALVFLTDTALQSSTPQASVTQVSLHLRTQTLSLTNLIPDIPYVYRNKW